MTRDFAAIKSAIASQVLAYVLAACCWAGAMAGAASAQTAAAAAPSAAAEPAQTAASPASAPASQSMLYPGEDFKLAPGDLIAVHVFLQPDYQATVRVGQDGSAQLPFIGSVHVEGLSVRAAQALIADRLRMGQFYEDPEVTIQVMDTVNSSAIITGEVRATVPVSSPRSLREVLLVAGGLPATASHTVKIVRPGVAEPIVVELGTDLASSTTASILVQPHDIIQISRASVVYVLGAFPRQGAVPLDQATPLTLLQLAALSGGINFEGAYADLRLIRTVGTERKVVKVDIKKIRDGRAPDPLLQANDIIFLPTDQMKAVIKSLGTGGVIGLATLLLTIHSF
ncbi:MAG TPA: polysaccharide biosynthesis/export family protein [Acidobacteriaceae bacterium]|jgi:polysaccharide export outer membrane protein|nr:polysaccharide biosynthesis/export family protein [Acidobacteriaceae bacterium]